MYPIGIEVASDLLALVSQSLRLTNMVHEARRWLMARPGRRHASRHAAQPFSQLIRDFTVLGGQLAHLTELRSLIRK